MDLNMDNKFYVVEFIDPPTKDFDKYVCIPDTWAFVTNDELVLIKYPLEKSSITKKRVKKREMYSDDWMVFEANIKFSTEVYRDAKNYIKVQKNILIQERSYAEVIDEECQPSTSGASSYDEQNSSTAETNKPTTEPPLNHAESDQPPLTDANLATHKEPTEVIKTANSANQGKIYLTRQARRLTELQKQESLLPTYTDSEDQRKVVTEESEEESNDFIESEDSEYVIDESTDMSESDESASSAIDNVSDVTKEPNDKVRHPIFQADFIDLMKQVHSCLKLNSEKSKFLRQEYAIQSSMVECVIKTIENFNTSGDLYKTLGVLTAGVNEIKIGGEIENIVEADSVQEAQREAADKILQENNVDDDYNNKNTTPIPRGRLRKFTLPPEYDENDSRWTLRYRKKDKHLQELVPHSEIYVNKISLSNCKRLSKDSKTLARMLLLEIFTKNALSTCSLTGKKANAYNTDAIRPGLDKNARIVLLNYVEQHAQENNWVKLDTQSILNTLRNKMQDMRIQDGQMVRSRN